MPLDNIEELPDNGGRDNRDSGDAAARDRSVVVDESAPLVHRSPPSRDVSKDLLAACIVLFVFGMLIVLADFIIVVKGVDHGWLNRDLGVIVCMSSTAAVGIAVGAVFYWLYSRRRKNDARVERVFGVTYRDVHVV
ncbi:hypothetical protein MRX96_000553 [Rhipicephalus microplus]